MASFPVALLLLLFGYATCSHLVEEDEQSDLAMLNPGLFEGDILGIDPNTDRNAMVLDRNRWPNGTIPYKILPELADKTQLITGAMRHIEQKTSSCIRFRPANDDDRYFLNIHKGNGCFTFVGRALMKQPLSLGNGCYMHSIVVHELMHAVGFYHEHSRSDRDDYIDIHWVNIEPTALTQFTKLRPTQNRLYDSFDFDSIMLYGELAFSRDYYKGLKTMTSKIPGKPIPDVYKKPGLSASDIYRVKKLYKC